MEEIAEPGFDVVDRIQRDIAGVFPGLDAGGLAITGRILVLADRINALREQVLGPFHLTQAEYDVLATLRRHTRHGGVNPGTLQRSVAITSGGLSKRIDRLEARGLVRRDADPGDRRAVLVRLTPKGRRLFDRALPAVLAAEGQLVRDALQSERDRSDVVELLRRLVLQQEG